MQLTEAEREAVELWRRLGFGTVTLHVKSGRPIAADVMLHRDFDKPEWAGAREVLTEQ